MTSICQCYPILSTSLLSSVGTSDKKFPANFHTISITPYLISVFHTKQVYNLFGKKVVIDTVLYFFNQATGRSS